VPGGGPSHPQHGSDAQRREWSGQGVDGPQAPPRFRQRLIRRGNNPAGAQSRSGKQPGASDHPIRTGRIPHRQQLLQHCSHRRPALRLVHCREDPRCDAGRDLLQVGVAVHQQLGADVGGCQRRGKDATGFRVHRGSQQGQPSGQGHNQRRPLLIAQRIPASL